MTPTFQKAKQVWEAALGELQLQVTRPSYETWLKGTVGIAHHDGEFVVGTPSTFVAEMLEQRMYSLISHTMERVTNARVDVRFEVSPEEAPGPYEHLHNGPQAGSDTGVSSTESQATPAESMGPTQKHRTTSLNPKYTFDTFVVGKANELARAASIAVSENPGTVYNPLVIYSDVGLGKTHLLHAISSRIQAKGMSVIYATTEEFTNQYISAIREGKTEEFRNRYRGTDVLLLDDIQFLIGKEQTQEGFFHTFNALHMINRQIVITSDRPVAHLTLLERRVRSRLTGGLVVDIQPPDLETRMAILQAKADLMRHRIDPSVLEFLSGHIRRNVRELEGTLNRVVVYAQLSQCEITIDLARRAVADILSTADRRETSPEAIVQAVAISFNIDPQSIKGARRTKHIALARQVTMYLLSQDANLGPTTIGRILGGRNHSTVVKSCAKIRRLLDGSPALTQDIESIRDRLAATTSAPA